MKFFTKEWYNSTIVAEMCFQLRKSEKAAVYSDKYFEKLYALEKKAFVKHYKRVAKFERKEFNIAETEAQFEANYKENTEFIKENLPEDILSDVKDLRILALGTATYEIADRIVRFCGKVNRKCEKADRDYSDNLEAIAEKLGDETVNSLDLLYNAPIESIEAKENSVEIKTSHINTGTACRVELKNARMPQNKDSYIDALIMRHELTENRDGNLCFALLCADQASAICELEIIADGIEIEEIF